MRLFFYTFNTMYIMLRKWRGSRQDSQKTVKVLVTKNQILIKIGKCVSMTVCTYPVIKFIRIVGFKKLSSGIHSGC